MSNYATYIQNIANILKSRKICSDTAPLLGGYKRGECNIAKLRFRIDIPRNTKPSVSLLDVFLDVSYKETNVVDIPISQYSFRITIEGQNETGMVKSSWHLDYDESEGQDYIHPHFHLTWGGNTIKDMNLGDILLLPTPRISYPPMDVVLGIDFVLSNFVKSDIYRQIQSDSQYKAAVKSAQEKYWKPYMLSLAHHWCNNSCCQTSFQTISAKHFHPTLID